MHDEMWQRGMRTVLSQFWRLPDQLLELRDLEPVTTVRLAQASCVISIAGLVHSLVALVSAASPQLRAFDPPLEHLNEAIDLGHEAAARDDLSPEAQVFALMNSLQLTANSLYGTALLLVRHAQPADPARLRLAAAASFFAVPAALVASHLETATALQRVAGAAGVPISTRALCHLGDLLARSALHLLCVGATGQPASTGLPSPLLPPPGQEQGPWPGFEGWRLGWSKSFGD